MLIAQEVRARVHGAWRTFRLWWLWMNVSAPTILVIPNTSSERREYVPIGWLSPSVVANQKLRILPDATLGEFALLTSAMHMAWMRQIGGRLESRYSYGVGVNYNTFPTPTRWANNDKIESLAQSVLDARAAYPDATLADYTTRI